MKVVIFYPYPGPSDAINTVIELKFRMRTPAVSGILEYIIQNNGCQLLMYDKHCKPIDLQIMLTILSYNIDEEMVLFFTGHGNFKHNFISHKEYGSKYYLSSIEFILLSIYKQRSNLSPQLNRIWLFNCESALGDIKTNHVMQISEFMRYHKINCQIKGVPGLICVPNSIVRYMQNKQNYKLHTDESEMLITQYIYDSIQKKSVVKSSVIHLFLGGERVRFVGIVKDGVINYEERYLCRLSSLNHFGHHEYGWKISKRKNDLFFKLYQTSMLEFYNIFSNYVWFEDVNHIHHIRSLSVQCGIFLLSLLDPVHKEALTNFLDILQNEVKSKTSSLAIPGYNKLIEITVRTVREYDIISRSQKTITAGYHK